MDQLKNDPNFLAKIQGPPGLPGPKGEPGVPGKDGSSSPGSPDLSQVTDTLISIEQNTTELQKLIQALNQKVQKNADDISDMKEELKRIPYSFDIQPRT